MTDPSQINNSLDQQLPTNGSGLITAAKLRAALTTGAGAGLFGLTAWVSSSFNPILGFTPPVAINIVDFGAKCDGGDDSAAINAAFAKVRTLYASNISSHLVFPAEAQCTVNNTINATGIKQKGVVIEGNGATVIGATSGKPIFDALSTEYMTWRGLRIFGNSSSSPNVGLRIGRAGTTANDNSDNILLDGITIEGWFSFAALHNLNAETSTFNHLVAVNNYGSIGAYTVVQDGINHFNATSQFVTVTGPVDTAESFNENVFINCDIRYSGPNPPIWMAGTTRHNWVSSYAAAVGGTVGVVLYQATAADQNNYLTLDLHVETPSVVNTYLLSGYSSPVLNGFRLRDHAPNGSNSLFKLDTGVTYATGNGVNWDIGLMQNGSKVFDSPTQWGLTGLFTIGNGVLFNSADYETTGLVFVNGKMRVLNSYFYTAESHRIDVVQTSVALSNNYHNLQFGTSGTPLSAPATASLPVCDSTTVGTTYGFVKGDASGNSVTVAPNGADTINGAASVVLSSQWSAANMQCNGNGVWIKGLS